MAVPEIVHLTVMTPYPGTEVWHTESRQLTTRDYRLFDIQHAVVPTRLPLEQFYRELVRTQAVINRKHLGLRTAVGALGILGRHLARGQTNFARMLWKFSRVYNANRQFSDHARPVRYELPLPERRTAAPGRKELFVHTIGRSGSRPRAGAGAQAPAGGGTETPAGGGAEVTAGAGADPVAGGGTSAEPAATTGAATETAAATGPGTGSTTGTGAGTGAGAGTAAGNSTETGAATGAGTGSGTGTTTGTAAGDGTGTGGGAAGAGSASGQ